MKDREYTTMRHIEIDAAHRVPEHGSKCMQLHGHRYKVEAHVAGVLAESGPETGMTMDFGFIKDGLIRFVHDPCDHGLILRYNDELLKTLAPELYHDAEDYFQRGGKQIADTQHWHKGLRLYLIGRAPTAEVLAAHWYDNMEKFVTDRTNNRATLAKIKVWETPNCWASYPTISGA